MKDKIDKLTGLYSRDKLLNEVGRKLKQGSKLGVAIMDLDFFSNINKCIGSKKGDIVLQKIAEVFPKDKQVLLARYGSDEFSILFEDKDREWVLSYINNLKQLFRRSKFITVYPYEKVRITFSMGVAFSSSELNGSFSLLKSAEIALFTAKKNGRNRIEYYKDEKIHTMKRAGVCSSLIGRSLKGSSKDGEDAYFASIAEPYGVEVDLNDDLLFVDRSNHQIKRIHKDKIYTVAGCGRGGYRGDGEESIRAKLCKPSGVCIDNFGRIYIADTGNHCIRKIENGLIYTVSGNGESGYSGDGGSALSARLNRPGGVVADENGNIYTNDYGNNVIRKIDKEGIITTIAGNGAYGFTGDNDKAVKAAIDKPYGLYVNPEGTVLYFADYGNHCIREVDFKTGIISTICGTGEAGYTGDGESCEMAQLNAPYWVYLKHNSLFIADSGNHCVRKINLKTKIITTVAGGNGAGYADHTTEYDKVKLNIPAGMAVSGSYLYIADYGNNAIRRVLLSDD